MATRKKTPAAPEPEVTGPPLIAPISEMDNKTFILHFNFRHADDTGKQGPIPERTDESALSMFRVFHRKIHQSQAGHLPADDHHHRRGQQIHQWQDGKEEE